MTFRNSSASLKLAPAETLWSPREVARFLAVSRSWVYRAAERGELPCLRIGALLRFEPAAIREWARSASQKPVVPLGVARLTR